MLEGNRCELCGNVIREKKAKHKQTKYHRNCAKAKKRENSRNPRSLDDQRLYMSTYMRNYREVHKGLSTPYVRRHRERKRKGRPSSGPEAQQERPLKNDNARNEISYQASALVLLFLIWFVRDVDYSAINFEAIRMLISHATVVVVEITGLVVIALMCWQHVNELLARVKTNNSRHK